MNWTGGRLQRSKANPNSLVKTQKQHFAKARLLLQNGHPSHSPIALSVLNGHITRDGQAVDNSAGQDKATKDRSGGPAIQQQSPRLRVLNGNEFGTEVSPSGLQREERQRNVEDSISKSETVRPGTGDRAGRTTQGQNGLARNAQHTSEYTRKSPNSESSTLAKVKQNLLKKSDWIGISATRPLQFEFQATEDMDRFGKRRKISHATPKHELDPQHVTRVQRRGHRNMIAGQLRAPTSILHTEDVSIRFGGNFHQSQTTPLLTARGALPLVAAASFSSESMLLDRLDHDIPVRTCSGEVASPDGSARCSCRSSPGSQVEQKLPKMPSLENFRNSESFDEVKSLSASRSPKAVHRTEQVTASRSRTANRKSLPGVINSSSIIRGNHLLVSSNSRSSADEDAQGGSERSEAATHESHQRTKPGVPTTLSSSFWPKNSPIDTSDEHSTLSSEMLGQKDTRLNKRPFTLEQQVSEEDAVSGHEIVSNKIAVRHKTITSGETCRSGLRQDGRKAGVKQIQDGPPATSPPGRSSLTVQDLYKIGGLSQIPQKRRGNIADLANSQGSPSQYFTSDTSVGNKPMYVFSGAPALEKEPFLDAQLPAMWEYLPQQGHWQTAQEMPTAEQDLQSSEAVLDESEAWKRFVNLEELESGFEFGSRHPNLPNRRAEVVKDQWPLSQGTDECVLQDVSISPPSLPMRQDSSPSKSIRTSANTVLHAPHDNIDLLQLEKQEVASETDFLTQWSPMEGKLDERLADISVYNNASRSVRSFVPAPSLHDASKEHCSGTSVDFSIESGGCEPSQVTGASSFIFTPARGGHIPKPAPQDSNRLPIAGSTHRRTHGIHKSTHLPSSPLRDARADSQKIKNAPLTLADDKATAMQIPTLHSLPIHSDASQNTGRR